MSEIKLSIPEIARMVMKENGRDNAKKQRILAGSPHLAHALDAGAIEGMSAGELAKAELKTYGIDCSGNSDPVEIRDAFHAGRHFERQGGRPSASMDSAGTNRVAKIIEEMLRE